MHTRAPSSTDGVGASQMRQEDLRRAHRRRGRRQSETLKNRSRRALAASSIPSSTPPSVHHFTLASMPTMADKTLGAQWIKFQVRHMPEARHVPVPVRQSPRKGAEWMRHGISCFNGNSPRLISLLNKRLPPGSEWSVWRRLVRLKRPDGLRMGCMPCRSTRNLHCFIFLS
jgi:hypothetical protein